MTIKLKVVPVFPSSVVAGSGITITKTSGIWTIAFDFTGSVGSAVQAWDADLDSISALSGTGIAVRTADTLWAQRSLVAPAAGITITNPAGIVGDPTFALANDLAAVEGLAATGIAVRSAADTWVQRAIAGTANEITLTNGDGVSGNPTASLPTALTFTGKTVTGGTFSGATITTSTYNGNTWTTGTGALTLGAGKTLTASNTLTFTGTDGSTAAFGAGGTVTYTSNNLSVFAATTSAQLRGVLSDETGTGLAYFQGGDIGTPSAGIATNITGLPVSTGISGLATGVATFLATPSSANLRGALTDETGTGAAVFGTSPNITTPTGIVKGDVGLGNVNNVVQVATVKKQVFTASGTYTPSAGMLYCIIECVGPGGGGGSAAGGVGKIFSGAGGGSGGYSRLLATAATIGASKAVTIGTGGAGGASGSNNGANGSGATSVGVLCIANAGSGGKFGSTAQVPTGGAGGTAGTGDLASTGAAGLPGFYNDASLTIAFPSGGGGSSAFGGGAQGVNAAVSVTTGLNGTAYGGGGSGAASNNIASNAAGGNGSDGVVIITEYCSQ